MRVLLFQRASGGRQAPRTRDGPGAPGGDELRLGEVLDAVVAALDVDVGVGKLDGLERHLVLEDDHEGDGLERGEYGGAVGLGVDRTVVALAEHLDGGVAVDGHDETAAEAAGLGEVGDVAAVQDVEDAVGHDARMRTRGGALGELVPRADLAFKGRGG